MGINTPFVRVCVCGRRLVGGQCRKSSYRGVRESYAQGRKSGVRRQPPCRDNFTPSLHQLFLPSASSPLGSLLVLCSSRREEEGHWDHSSPGFCALRVQPGTCRAEEATALRAPGRRHKTRERVDLGEGFLVGSSVTAATTVPTSMGMLTVPKLGPPAQDLVGAVLPTATRHAGGGVIDFKL